MRLNAWMLIMPIMENARGSRRLIHSEQPPASAISNKWAPEIRLIARYDKYPLTSEAVLIK